MTHSQHNNTVANMPPLKRSGTSVGPPATKRTKKTKTSKSMRSRNGGKKSSFNKARVIKFQRMSALDLQLNSTSPPTGWSGVDNGITSVVVVGLDSIPGYTDFQNLFESYRLTGLRIRGYYSGTVADRPHNQNVIMQICPNYMGNVSATDLNEQWFLDRPRSKTLPLLNTEGKPSFDEYIPLTQLTQMYASVTNTDYALTSPHFIATSETDTPHYGFAIRIARVDGQTFTFGSSDPYPYLKLHYTYYLEMRGVA